MFFKQISYIVIGIISILIAKVANISYNPESFYFTKGYGQKSESIGVLLDRTEWVNHYKGRLNLVWRHLFYSMAIVFMASLVVCSELPQPLKYIQGVLIVFVLLQTFHHYTQHHCEKFGHYAVDRNIKLIRKKLKLKKGWIKPQKCKFSGDSGCWNFVYSSET